MFKKIQDKKLEKDLIATIALNWGVTKRVARECLYRFVKQNTK